MTTYLVTWRIDIEADSPEEAAAQALATQRDPESTATVFDVTPTVGATKVGATQTIDLDPEAE